MDELLWKRRVFVGSSTEGQLFAENVIVELEKRGLSPLPWYDFFQNERPPLQELEHLTLQVDGAVLVATSDDQAIIRKRQWHQMRDNVLFEYGLFAGRIGRAKCGLLVPDVVNFRIPSDFLGVACFETYRADNIDVGASTVVESLATALSKPKRAENVQSRGRRLLALLGWIRDESYRLVHDWNNEHGREIVSDRIVAVSAFIREDIDSLNLRREYDTVERVVLKAAEQFPHITRDYDRGMKSKLRTALNKLVNGDVPAEPNVWCALLDIIKRDGLGRYPYPYFTRWERPKARYWMDFGLMDWYSYLLGRDWYNYWGQRPLPDRPMHGPLAWATGVAEAVTVFEQVAKPTDALRPLKDWSERFLPKLNESIVAFERRLHEEIFGRL